jgi:FKBP-type peptidyl-prolyl cis-trans isomerase
MATALHMLLLFAVALTPPPDAIRLPSGTMTQVLAPGSGSAHAADSDYVKLHYTIYSPEGKQLDAVQAPRQGVVAVEKLKPGWREAIEAMTEGEQRRVWLPDEKLIIDTELVGIVHPPATPADVAAPPADATVTKSGLAYKILRPGTGEKHPSRRSVVRVHYSGWTTDGKLFDSSVVRGEPSEFPVEAVIPGWSEGLQLMTPGEIARFWIPAKLAYANDKTKPQGMLVFDVELIGIR